MNSIPKTGYMRDITGQRFGRLTALQPVSRGKNGAVKWLFKCDCGTQHVALAANVLGGRTKSCGCLRRESSTLRSREMMLRRHRERRAQNG
ncbi:MAG: hypothetical protein IJP23_03830 [Oscillospiraceae bacterium]|nr:hypothetical protein [Oscillospiraceae bacterium]